MTLARPLDLHALEAFVMCCDCQSMTQAGARLGITQSAVSQLVKNLERDTGTLLLDRDQRPPKPTAAGRALREQATGLLAHARSVSDQARSGAPTEGTRLLLGCVDSFAATVGPSLIRALSGRARDLLMWSGLTPALTEQLMRRDIDMAIVTDAVVADPRIAVQPLFSEAFVLVLPRIAANSTDGGDVDPPMDLHAAQARWPLIRYSLRSVMGQQVERCLRHFGVQAPRRFEFDATDPLMSLVAAGLGWAITTPLCLLQSRHHLGDVRVLPLPATALGRREFFLLCREGEWQGLDDEIVRLTQQVIAQHTRADVARLMPTLPPEALQVSATGRSGPA
ncbi:MAG: LysR family transcriptional regulator [Pseudomonadota bacterium]|nr:LysR family transcriptional regulator [Pseudomonadota bacterium]